MRRREQRGETFALTLDFEADKAHQFDAVALGDDSVAELEVELHLAVFDLVLEMDVVEASVSLFADVCKGQVVCADEADGAARQQGAHESLRPDETIFGVCALEELIEQEEDGRVAFGEIADLTEAGDLGVEAGVAFLQRIVDENAGANM